MTETGTIKAIDGSRILIGCGDTEGCKTCGGSGFCSVKERTFEAENNKELPLQVGDSVNIFLPTGQTVFAAFLVMIVPLLLFILFFFLYGKLWGTEKEGFQVLFGLIGLGGGFLMSYLYSRNRKKGRLPVITGKSGPA